MGKMVKIEPILDKFMTLTHGEILTTLAIESGFVKRRPRKIDPKNFLIAFFIMVLQHGKSLSSIAMTLGILKGIRVSKQAIDKRIKEPLVRYLESVLAHTIAQKIKIKTCCQGFPPLFKRILLHDSTTIRLPSHLADVFPGSKNAKKDDIALLKIQTIYDVLRERFCSFWMSPFTTNDQEAATTMLDCIHQGDLIIRDLGYFVLGVLALIQQEGAFFISRLRHGTALYDTHSGERINLLKLLKKHQKVDMPILVGRKERLAVRLIAVPVDPVVAAQRRRKLRANRDRRLNPSKEHLALLGWNIFVLDVDADTLSAEEVVSLYGLRWRIETIFKAWKSNFNLTAFPRASVVHIQAYMYAFLIFVTLFHTVIYSQTNMLAINKQNKPLSLLKLSRCFREQFWAIAIYLSRPAILFEQINYHCTYEKRDDRLNYHQKLTALS
jgi:hypothetical protein